jgi:DUF1680 family protein
LSPRVFFGNTPASFGDTLTTTITAAKAFTYLVRIPSWVTKGTISVNGGPAEAVAPGENGLHAVSVGAGTTALVLEFPSEIRIGILLAPAFFLLLSNVEIPESRPHGSIAIHRGPLNYAFDSTRPSL